MVNLPKITDIDLNGKKVILRLDLDIGKFDSNDLRVKSSIKTLDFLKDKKCNITIIAHRGRPNGKFDENLSFKSFQKYFNKWGAKLEENLRFNKGEEENDPEFSKKLSLLGEVYINDAFASSHRNHASIVGLAKLLPSAFGFRFIEEVEVLSKKMDKPVYVVLSGIKKDKVEMAKKLSNIFDKVLVGGRLPEYFGDNGIESIRLQGEDNKLIIGNLLQDKEDITLNTIERFKKELSKASTVILAGVLGKYEDGGHVQGTKEVFEYITKLNAFKIAGGGDTEDYLKDNNMIEKFDWVSVGGGAMIEFLINKTLPGIEAVLN